MKLLTLEDYEKGNWRTILIPNTIMSHMNLVKMPRPKTS